MFKSLALYSLQKLFDYVDKDNSGSISKAEIIELVKEIRALVTKLNKSVE